MLGEFCKSSCRGNFHIFIDGPCAHIQRAAKNKRKPKDIVDLIGIVGTARGDNGIIPHFGHFFRRDFRVRISHGKDDRIFGHGSHHVGRHRAFDRQAEEGVCAFDGVFQCSQFGVGCVGGLPLIHAFGAACVNHPFGIAHNDVFRSDPEGFRQFDTGDCGGAGAVYDNFNVGKLASGDVARIDKTGGGNDCCAVLVVMKNRDIHDFAQTALDNKAFGRLYVLKIDSAEGGP